MMQEIDYEIEIGFENYLTSYHYLGDKEIKDILSRIDKDGKPSYFKVMAKESKEYIEIIDRSGLSDYQKIIMTSKIMPPRHKKRIHRQIEEYVYDVINDKCAMHKACNESHFDVVKLLISIGWDVNLMIGGMTPLHIACSRGHIGLVEMLLDKGADVTLKDMLDSTALDIASDSGHQEIYNLIKSKMEEKK